MRAMIGTLSIVALAALWALPAAAAPTPAEIFVARLNASIGRSGASGAEGPRALCGDVVRWALDFDAVAPVASAGAWERMDESERDAYRAALEHRLVDQCAGEAAALSKPAELVGTRSGQDGDLLVATRPAGEPLTHPLVWRGRVDKAGAFRVTDLLVDGRSAVLATRDAAREALARSGGSISALLQSLQR